MENQFFKFTNEKKEREKRENVRQSIEMNFRCAATEYTVQHNIYYFFKNKLFFFLIILFW